MKCKYCWMSKFRENGDQQQSASEFKPITKYQCLQTARHLTPAVNHTRQLLQDLILGDDFWLIDHRRLAEIGLCGLKSSCGQIQR